VAVEGGGTIVNGVHDQEPGGDDAARPVRSADRVLAAARAAGSSQAQIGGSGVGAGHGRVGGGEESREARRASKVSAETMIDRARSVRAAART